MASKSNKQPEVRGTIMADGSVLLTTVPPFWGLNRKERRKLKLPPSTDHRDAIAVMKMMKLPGEEQ